MSRELPFAVVLSPTADEGPGGLINGRLGYMTVLRGALLSAGPFGTVTGPAQLFVEGLANGTTDNNSGGTLAVNFLPSTTEVVNIPLAFDESSVQAMAPDEPITFLLQPHGSDSPGTVSLNVWGALVPVPE